MLLARTTRGSKVESNLKCRAAERKSVEVRSPCQKSRACLYLHDHQMHRASTLWRKCTWGQSFLEEAITAEPSLISAPFTKVRDHWKEKGRNGKQKLVDFFHPYLYLQFLKGKKSLNTSSFILCIFRQSNLVHRKQKHADNSISTSKIHWSKGHRQKWERHPVVFGFILNCKCNKKYLEEKILTIPQPALVLSLPVIEHYQ